MFASQRRGFAGSVSAGWSIGRGLDESVHTVATDTPTTAVPAPCRLADAAGASPSAPIPVTSASLPSRRRRSRDMHYPLLVLDASYPSCEVSADIQTREDCERLVRAFYSRALTDPIIGFIFTDVAHLDVEAHVPVIASFW